MKKENLLVLSLIFPPDGVSSSQLLGEIVEDLSVRYGKVTVVTTSPHYNVDVQARKAQPIRWNLIGLIGYSSFLGSEVVHIRMTRKAGGKFGRLLQWLWFHVVSFFVILRRRNSFDKILTISPPITIAVVCLLIKKLLGKPYMFVVWELYPDILVSLGYIARNGIIYRVLKWLEVKSYAGSSAIAVLHQSMKDSVLKTLPSVESKVFVIPTFADTDQLRPLSAVTNIRKDFNLGSSFVVLYAGNMGKPQNLQLLLNAALLLKERTDIKFFLCGDGGERENLVAYAEHNELQNVVIAEHMPYDKVSEIYASCDISVVPLAGNVSAEALPSKIYRSLACGRPILGICEPNGPLSMLVTENHVGVVCGANDPSLVAKAICEFSEKSDLVGYRNRARDLAVQNFSRQSVTELYAQVLNDL